MNLPAPGNTHFPHQEMTRFEADLDERLLAASGLVGVALIEVGATELVTAGERLADHLDPEDHTARFSRSRFAIVRGPLTGPAEMEGLGLRIADSFPAPPPAEGRPPRVPVHIGVVTGRRGDSAQTLLRHVQYGLEDARTIGRAMVAVDDRPIILDSLPDRAG